MRNTCSFPRRTYLLRPPLQRLSRQGGAFCCASLLTAGASLAASIAVDAGAVTINGGDGLCSLPEAIQNANADMQLHLDCDAGSGPDTIELAPATYTFLNSIQNSNALPNITSEIVIEGNSSTLLRDTGLVCNLDGNRIDEFRFFFVQGASGNLTLNDLSLLNGCADGSSSANDGGAIKVAQGTLTINRVLFEGNQARDKSGAIDTAAGAQTTITDSTFTGNYAGGGAGAIGNGFGCSMTIDRSLVYGNSADGLGGGGIGNFGTIDITNSTVSSNSTLRDGGGIGSTGTINLSNSTVAHNEADNNATDAGSGGNIGSAGSLVVKNSIVANQEVGVRGMPQPDRNNCYVPVGTLTGQGENFETDGTCVAIDAGFTEVDVDDLALGSISAGGSSTETHALGIGSNAVDAVTDCTTTEGDPVATDQRGVARPQRTACDLGAHEREEAIFEDGFESGGTGMWSSTSS